MIEVDGLIHERENGTPSPSHSRGGLGRGHNHMNSKNKIVHMEKLDFFHQWGLANLHPYDLLGKKEFKQEVIRTDRKISLDVSP